MSTASVFDVTLSDGTEHRVKPLNPSYCAWDRTRATREWPTFEVAPFLWMTFLAWHHMKAAGLIPSDTKFETFEGELCTGIEGVKGSEAGGADPTQPAATPDAPSS